MGILKVIFFQRILFVSILKPKEGRRRGDGSIFKYIQSGYRGGYVEVFKPYGQDITGYDVISLYPYKMDFSPMSVGQPTAFVLKEGRRYYKSIS